MDGLGARIAAALLAASGIAMLWWQPAAGIVLVVSGVAVALLGWRSAEPLAEPSFMGLVKGLGLEGPGHHVPWRDSVKLFLPADAHGPYLMPEMGDDAIHREPPASIGLSMEPPGAPLLERWAAVDALPRGQGAEEAMHHLRRALPRLGIASKVQAARRGDTLAISCRLRHPEAALAAQASGWHLKGGSAAQSFICAIAALAMQAPVAVARSATQPDGRMELEVVPGTMA